MIGATRAAKGEGKMQFDLGNILSHMGVPAMLVAAALLAMGVASLTVVIERLFMLRSSRAASRRFAVLVGAEVRDGRFEGVVERAEEPAHRRGHLARILGSGLKAYLHAKTTPDISGLPPAERTRRHLERFMEEIGADLRRGMGVLASVGSTAPFVGLLGTVLGIISAFQGIAATGSGGLSAISAGISEALIETALGLAVAIPAVLAFNYLSSAIAREAQVLNHAAGELLDTIEDWEERRQRRAAISPVQGQRRVQPLCVGAET
jgi:biopolymer transport protein ExbB